MSFEFLWGPYLYVIMVCLIIHLLDMNCSYCNVNNITSFRLLPQWLNSIYVSFRDAYLLPNLYVMMFAVFSNMLKDTQLHILADSDEHEIVRQVQVTLDPLDAVFFFWDRIFLIILLSSQSLRI